MYSYSIRERQQELLDVLFKKASGRFEFEEDEGTGVSTDPEFEQLSRVLNEASRLPTNPFAAEQTKITEPEKPKVTKPNWSNIKRVAGDRIRKMTGVDAIVGMSGRVRDGMTPIISGVKQNLTAPAGSQPAPTNPETPTSSAPEGEGGASPETPTTPEGGAPTQPASKPKALTEAEQAAEKAKKNGQPPAKRAELDWNKVLKGLIEKLKRHKITGIGGLGGFGLGALIGGGGSFTDRLLWALLGGGAGTGLGYLVEKYLK